ncbi:MAG: PhzF family phenazine biosynthesis protein [Candidatus Neomarinimicrobiota bacterium]
MRIPYYQVDAFTGSVFAGNPAGVCPLTEWPVDELLQSIAAENNLSETAFFVREGDHFHLRWFTPVVEVNLCGHATLATAFVLFNKLNFPGEHLRFRSLSGELNVTRAGDLLTLDFPAQPARPVAAPPELTAGLGQEPQAVLKAVDYLVVYESAAQVRSLHPRMDILADFSRGVIATAPGEDCDFVSRFFAPAVGIPEDPVTGSAHTTLTPYWSQRLDKKQLHARQISVRGGELYCTDRGDRVAIAGRAVIFLEGEISI